LVQIVERDFLDRDIEMMPQLVADAADDHPLVFQRLRVGDVELEECNGDNHEVLGPEC